MEKFDTSLYNDEFFAWHKKYTDGYSLSTGKKLFEHYKPKSVVDFGCGIGSYLSAAYDFGILKLRGFDIGSKFAKIYTDKRILEFIDFDRDITTPIYFDCGYCDMAICIEVAEHINPKGSDMLVENISSTAKMCVFTAAPPGQGGCGHVNEMPKEYWSNLFGAFDME